MRDKSSALDKYHHLHDLLSDMIEDGRLTRRHIPKDYDALVETLATINQRNTYRINVWDDVRPDHVLHDY